MRFAVLSLALLVAALATGAAHAGRPATIPALRHWTDRPGEYVLRPSTRIVAATRELLPEAGLLAADLDRLSGRRPRVELAEEDAPREGDVELRLGASDRRLGREGYALTAGSWLRIEARSRAGAFYGTRTLLQLLRRSRRIPGGEARDWPRYPERGLMVDNGRKHFTAGWIRSRIRELAYLKLNQLHLHFSDNEGFRIESEGHPEVVSRRHLTKRQVRRIVALARRHHIRVIPELDMPGHLAAALAAHPELQLRDRAGVRSRERLDFTLPAARRFARELILEYLRLFRGRYWHAGADEYLGEAAYASYPQLERWAERRHGPGANGPDAYLDFINWVDRMVRGRGRVLRVWHDGLAGGRAVRVRPRVVVDWWADHAGPGPRELLRSGHRVLNAGWFPTYYVVGPAGAVRPSMEAAYRGWQVNRFAGLSIGVPVPASAPEVVPPGERRVLGSELHVWNDDPDGETQARIARGIAPRLRLLAQKTWRSPQPSGGYARFLRIARLVGGPPGLE